MLRELEAQVLLVYAELDLAVKRFAEITGLACPPGCGRCCASEKVEATVLECIPLAFELFRLNQAELILKRLEKRGEKRQCLLYRPDWTREGRWGCTQYRHRTVVCRLFGFAGNRDRRGIKQLAMCRIMKPMTGAEAASVLPSEAASAMPLFADAGLRVTALHPALGTRRQPINQALQEALVKVGIFLDHSEPSPAGKRTAPVDPPDKPLFPLPPLDRRAA